MRIHDLTPFYKKHILQDNDLAAYERAQPALFAHYFTYWADRTHWRVQLTEDACDERAGLIRSVLPKIEQQLAQKGLFADCEVILFVGNNTANGDAFFE